MRYVIDAHTLIWYLRDDPRLGKNAGDILDDRRSQIVLPAIALAEVYWIIEHKPAKVGSLTIQSVKSAVSSVARTTLYPLNRRVVEKSLSFTAINEMHDRLITATVAVMIDDGEKACLLTRDQNITESGYVPVLW